MSRTMRARRAAVGAVVVAAAAAGLVTQGTVAYAGAPTGSVTASPSGLDLGSVPTHIPFTETSRLLVGQLEGGRELDVVVRVKDAGRYTLQYSGILASVVGGSVDGTALRPTQLGDYDHQFSQTFYLGAGEHVIHVDNTQAVTGLNVYLYGTL
ncbi:hypothetical protein ACFWN1_18735 [Streptomyces sp. NPDC058459]|uniref:hypothetical protein n=1 Tax=Streptomyces sp. NPDC058459 TaxID=3346508 RepID=UPI003647AD57